MLTGYRYHDEFYLAVVTLGESHLPTLTGVEDLTKVLELLHPPAVADVLAVPHHLPQVVVVGLLASLVALAHVDELPQPVTVPVAVEHHTDRPLSVTTSSPGLLVVTLDRLGQTLVNDEPHIYKSPLYRHVL